MKKKNHFKLKILNKWKICLLWSHLTWMVTSHKTFTLSSPDNSFTPGTSFLSYA